MLRGLLARNAGAVIELAQLARWAARASWPKLLAPVRPAWIAAYPAALEGTLSRLAAADPDAEATARRRIAAVLPDRRADRARPPRCAHAPRSVRASPGGCKTWRRASPRPGLATRAQLARLAAKLDAAALDKGAARFEAALTDAARGRLMRRLEIDALPQLPVDRTQRAVVFALARSPGG